jgi:hypothetical protein
MEIADAQGLDALPLPNLLRHGEWLLGALTGLGLPPTANSPSRELSASALKPSIVVAV